MRFLSNEWVEAALDALNQNESFIKLTRGVDLTIQQEVLGVPGDGDVQYWARIRDGNVSGGRGVIKNPDATIHQAYEVAIAINEGQLKPPVAFIRGKIRVSGDVKKLMLHQGVVNGMRPVLATVPTEYDATT